MISAIFLLLFLFFAWQDWKTRTLPTIPLLLSIFITPFLAHHTPAQHWLNSLFGGFLTGGLFLLIYLLIRWVKRPYQMGEGDVLLTLLIGCWGGIYWGMWAIATGMICAGLFSFIGWKVGRYTRHTSLPYGTFLLVGAILIWMVVSVVSF